LGDSAKKTWQHWEDLPKEKEDELIEKIAGFIVKNNFGLIAQMLFETGGSLSSMFATLGMGLFGPYLEFFNADVYGALFRKKENLDLLMRRIEELEDEQELKKSKEKEQKNKEIKEAS
jgi:hypothetical protein